MAQFFDPVWMLTYFALGAVVGWLGGLFGIGGGLILVPVLLFAFDAQHFSADVLLHLALGTAMATILFTSLASMRKHHHHGAVNWTVVRGITPGILLGTALGALLTTHIPTNALAIFFALFVYFSATQILLDITPHASRQLPNATGLTLFGTMTGCLSSLVSIGGGSFVVPFLLWCNVSLRHAIGTSAAVGFPIAFGGSIGYIVTGWHNENLPAAHLGYIYLPALLWIALASVLTAPMGARAAHRMKVAKLRKYFAVLLMMIATKMLLKIYY
ncbi:MAG: hypothetical protein RLZZ144_447 [Pseudomonadota bacterium]